MYLDEEVISFCLGRIRRIWLIKQVLNSHKNLLHGYGWSPPLHIPEGLLCYTRASSLWLVSNPMNNTSYKLFRVAKGTYTILVKNGQTDSARWVDIRVEEIWREFTFWGLARVVFTEVERQWEVATLPISLQLDDFGKKKEKGHAF